MAQAIQIMRVRVEEHASRRDAGCEQALDRLTLLVQHTAFGVHEQSSAGVQAVGVLLRRIEWRRVDGHHHASREIEVLVLARCGHLVPTLDGGHELVCRNLHKFRKLFERVGFERVLARGRGHPHFLRTVARRAGRPDLVDLLADGPVHDVEVVRAGLRLDGHCQMAVRLVFGREAFAQLVHAQIRHELFGIERYGLRELVFGSAYGKAHLMPIAGVAERTGQPVAGDAARAATLLEHLLVELVAAGGQHHALGAVVLLVALLALHDDAGHLARVVGDQLTGGRAVADLDASVLQDAGKDARQLARRVRKVERGVPRARHARRVPFVTEVGEVACSECERVVVKILIVEVTDVPVHGLSVRLEPMAVQGDVALERAVDHRVGQPGLGVIRHAPVLMDLGVRAADGGGVVIAGGLLFHGDGFQAVLGAGERRRVAGGAEAAHHHVHVVRGHDVVGGDGVGHERDLAFAGGVHLDFFHDGPYGLRRIGCLHGTCRCVGSLAGRARACVLRGVRCGLRCAAGKAGECGQARRGDSARKERAAAQTFVRHVLACGMLHVILPCFAVCIAVSGAVPDRLRSCLLSWASWGSGASSKTVYFALIEVRRLRSRVKAKCTCGMMLPEPRGRGCHASFSERARIRAGARGGPLADQDGGGVIVSVGVGVLMLSEPGAHSPAECGWPERRA